MRCQDRGRLTTYGGLPNGTSFNFVFRGGSGRRRRVAAASMAILFAPSFALPATYTVDARGDDANTGASDAPFASIQHAISIAGPGDAIVARDGYYPETIRVDRSGAPGSPLVIRAENARGARIDGVSISADDIVLDGFTIHDNHGTAVSGDRHRDPRPTRVTVRNFYILQPAMGIQVNGHDWLVENNEIERLVRWIDEGDNDYGRFFGSGHVIRNNYFHGTIRGSISPAHVDGFQTFTTSYKGLDGVRDVIIEGNVITDMHQGVILEGSTTMRNSNVIIRDNIFANAWSWGALLKNFSDDVVVEHNIFYNIGHHGSGSGEEGSLTVRDNIFSRMGESYFARDGGRVTGDYNLIHSANTPSPSGANDLIGPDPQFADPEAMDFRLLPGSPAIGAAHDGSNLGPRPLGEGPQPTPTPSPTPTPIPTPTPQPRADELVLALGFDEADGQTAADASGQGHGGELEGPTWTDGRFGGALAFDGVDDWVTVADTPMLDVSMGMTLMAWVRPEGGLDGWRHVIDKEGAAGKLAYYLAANSSRDMPWAGFSIGGQWHSTGGGETLGANAWTHLASTFDGSMLRVYINGSLVADLEQHNPIEATNGALHIGGNLLGEYFAGSIDEVRVYSRALDPAEITQLMATPVGDGDFINPFEPIADVDFTVLGDAGGQWTGAVLAGEASFDAAVGAGLCMTAAAEGDNTVGWVGPEDFIDLIDGAVYRVRARVSTDQTAPDSIPLWSINYDNYSSSGLGNTFGGQATYLDVASGANGIGRPEGRDEFEFYLTPNAALTPQWRGTLDDGTAGAFSPEADAYNDIRLSIFVLDAASAGINAAIDSGTICVESISVEAIAISELVAGEIVYDTPISSSTHAAIGPNPEPRLASTNDEDNRMTIALHPSEDHVTILPAVEPFGVDGLYPIAWEDNALYQITVSVESGADSTEADPVDAIMLSMDSMTSELTVSHYTTRGAPGNMFRAASPRLGATAGGPQTYTAFFHGNNASLAKIEGAARLRPQIDLFNTINLFGDGTGGDPLEILALNVAKIELP